MLYQQRTNNAMNPTPDWYDWLPVRHESIGRPLLAFATDPTRVDDFTISVARDAFLTGDESSFVTELQTGQAILPEGRVNFSRYESVEHKALQIVLAEIVAT